MIFIVAKFDEACALQIDYLGEWDRGKSHFIGVFQHLCELNYGSRKMMLGDACL